MFNFVSFFPFLTKFLRLINERLPAHLKCSCKIDSKTLNKLPSKAKDINTWIRFILPLALHDLPNQNLKNCIGMASKLTSYASATELKESEMKDIGKLSKKLYKLINTEMGIINCTRQVHDLIHYEEQVRHKVTTTI